MSASLRRVRTVEDVLRVARAVHPQPFRLAWADRQRRLWGGACRRAVDDGLLVRVRGRAGADYFALVGPVATK